MNLMARGGTVHIVVNNQIGFTTDPRFARSTPYATDIGKAYDCPVFHVNGDDAEAITFIHQLAADWRQQFKTDVIIDIICYRKQGHNETDQPSFTQPRMYEVIKNKKAALEVYINQLLEEGTLTKEDVEEHKKWFFHQMACLTLGSGDNWKTLSPSPKTTNHRRRNG